MKEKRGFVGLGLRVTDLSLRVASDDVQLVDACKCIYIYKHLVARSVESGNVESDFKMMTLG